MKKYSYFIFLFLFCQLSKAQVNLVQNGDFFEFYYCPTNTDQFDYAKHWFSLSGSPQFFHCCSNSSVNVPNTLMGFQHGKNEDAFAGIVLWYPWYVMREYIQTKLSKPLVKDKKYCVTFYVNLADGSAVAIDKIGAVLSKDTIKADTIDGLIDMIPQILNESGTIISDTVNWIKISGEYIAQGGEQVLTIGNFFSDSETNVDTVNPISGGYAYYFIDDVSVYECEEAPSDTITFTNAFTPNGDGVNDVFRVQGQNIKTLNGKIFNRWGQELYNWTDIGSGWDGKYKGNDVPEGTYFYVITSLFEDGVTKSYTGSILLTR
ncbi:MAG: hypothetical protein BWY70_00954 [Bacteroidetes bacterium ADurb.Bin408]|nr:MAG: hypothetical protein BWY70_00954 [Bacteroidetes bacterium ADurb.Bin408]